METTAMYCPRNRNWSYAVLFKTFYIPLIYSLFLTEAFADFTSPLPMGGSWCINIIARSGSSGY
jgi:hypothetical protein